jgi:hypothetical protein
MASAHLSGCLVIKKQFWRNPVKRVGQRFGLANLEAQTSCIMFRHFEQ